MLGKLLYHSAGCEIGLLCAVYDILGLVFFLNNHQQYWLWIFYFIWEVSAFLIMLDNDLMHNDLNAMHVQMHHVLLHSSENVIP